MSQFIPDNRVTLLRNGTAYFPALLQALEDAEQEIHLQTYIFEIDMVGRMVAEALKRAALRGLSVCLLLDGFGCKDLPGSFIDELEESGVQVLIFRPKISPWSFKRNRLRRLHRKIAVVDGRIAFVGGINIIDDMNTPGHTPPRIDYAVCVEGPLLVTIRASARRLWRQIAWARLRRVDDSPLRGRLAPEQAGSMWAAFVVRDNIWHRTDIEDAYLAAIDSAEREILIANSYFLPGIRFRRAMVAAARRGVRVILLLQARVEYVLLDYASHALYDQMLAAGIEIYEYEKSFMHSKVAVIDSRWATVGSSNIDPFSLMLSREANVVVEDAGFAAELRADIGQAIRDGARPLKAEDWQRAPLVRRWLSSAVYVAIRLALGVIGYPDRH